MSTFNQIFRRLGLLLLTMLPIAAISFSAQAKLRNADFAEPLQLSAENDHGDAGGGSVSGGGF